MKTFKQHIKEESLSSLEKKKVQLFLKAMKMVSNSPNQMEVRKELDDVWKKIKAMKEGVELNEMEFTSKQLAQLKKDYAGIKKIDPSSDTYKKMRAMIDSLPKEALQSLVNAKINFISILANNSLRKLKEEYVTEGLSPQKDMENKLDRLIDADNVKAAIEWSKYVDKLGPKFVNPSNARWTAEHVKVMDKLIKKYRIKQ